MPDISRLMPAVSIGLPVYNGARYLDETIRSILHQSYQDLELIICDNASTDATPEICARHAAADPRVRYVRQPSNLGAGPNYDDCFNRARGRFFKWAAHDDLLAPDYLALTVAALDCAPHAVLCTTGVAEIGPDGAVMREYVNRFPGVESTSPAHRLAAVIHTEHQCEDFFGLFRRESLVGSSLHGTRSGSDRVLLAEMALRGHWVSIEAPLFLHREHPHRYTRALLLMDRKAAAQWQDSAAVTRMPSTLFHWGVYREYWRVVRANVAEPTARLACRAELLRWWFTNGHAADMLRDLAKAVDPRLYGVARTAKRAVFGAGDRRAGPGALPEV